MVSLNAHVLCRNGQRPTHDQCSGLVPVGKPSRAVRLVLVGKAAQRRTAHLAARIHHVRHPAADAECPHDNDIPSTSCACGVHYMPDLHDSCDDHRWSHPQTGRVTGRAQRALSGGIVRSRSEWRWVAYLVPFHRRLIGLASTSGSHPPGHNHDGNEFHHTNREHRPQHTGQDSEQSHGERPRPTTIGQPIGGDQGADRGNQPPAQVHVQQHLDQPLPSSSTTSVSQDPGE